MPVAFRDVQYGTGAVGHRRQRLAKRPVGLRTNDAGNLRTGVPCSGSAAVRSRVTAADSLGEPIWTGHSRSPPPLLRRRPPGWQGAPPPSIPRTPALRRSSRAGLTPRTPVPCSRRRSVAFPQDAWSGDPQGRGHMAQAGAFCRANLAADSATCAGKLPSDSAVLGASVANNCRALGKVA